MTARIPYDGLEVVEPESRGWSWPAEGTGARDPSILEGQKPPGATRPALERISKRRGQPKPKAKDHESRLR